MNDTDLDARLERSYFRRSMSFDSRAAAFYAGLWAGVGLAAVGCASHCPGTTTAAPATAPAAAVTESAAAGTAHATSNLPAGLKNCPEGLIDDAEDNDNRVAVAHDRGGYWYTYTDDVGSTISPKHQHFVMSPGGANGSQYAAHMAGQMAASGTIYAGMGFNFSDPKRPYNATFAKGISFRARIGAGSHATVRVTVGDFNTDPEGKVCKDKCYNDFGVDLTLTDKWTQYTVPFSTMTQQPYWGEPRPPSIDASKVFGVQWKESTAGIAYDVWVDDVQFVCE